MNLVAFIVRNPVKVSVGVLLLALFGVVSVFAMPKQLIPEVSNPVLQIETQWPGASPQEVEREIIQEQEEQLKNVEGVIKMTSTCSMSQGQITLEFAVGTNLEEALLKVNTRLQQVQDYPIDANEPVITTRDISDRPIARLALMEKPPSQEELSAFQKAHPELAELVESAQRAINPGLRVYRLQKLHDQVSEHPELRQIIPEFRDLEKMLRFCEDVIEARLERVDGVSDAEINGGRVEELQVIVDPKRLAAHRVTIDQIRTLLQDENKDTSAGDFSEGNRREFVRTLGQFRSVEQVKNLVIRATGGEYLQLKDVAEVELGYHKAERLSRRYGVASLSLSVSRSTGANVLAVMEDIKAAVDELNQGVLADNQLELYLYYDETEYIHSAIKLVQENIFIGGALTMIVLLMFLNRNALTILATPVIAATAVAAVYLSPWFFAITLTVIIGVGFLSGRSALVVGLAIPTSIVGTFLLMNMLGRSLNVISLAGLAFAVGMLVDNAVVVLENIHSHWQRGDSPLQAAVRGTAEVAGAVLASTLTTIAVFLPVIFVQDLAGQLFRDIALAVSCAVGLSMLISFTLIPMLSSRLYRQHEEPTHHANGKIEHLNGHAHNHGHSHSHAHASEENNGWVSRFLVGAGSLMVTSVVDINRFIQKSRAFGLAVILVMLGAAFGLTWVFWPQVDYLPTGNQNYLFTVISPPPGYNLEKLTAMGEKIENDLQPYWDVDPSEDAFQDLDYPAIGYYFFVVRGRQVMLGARSYDASRAGELRPLLKDVGSQFPGTIAAARQSSLFERGGSGGRNIDIEITGEELPELIKLGQRVMADVKRIMPTAQALPQPSLDLSSPEVHVKPRLYATAEQDLDADELGYAVNAFIDGAYATDYYMGGDKIDLSIVGAEGYVINSQDIRNLPIATASGEIVNLGTLAEVEMKNGPEQINRSERQRVITIQVNPPDDVPLETAISLIENEIVTPMTREGLLENSYRITLSGTADQLEATWQSLKWNFLLSLLITYLLMAALFESWLYPFVIILTVPLGAVGGVLGLALLNLFIFQPLDVLTMLGFVILVGTVVNNAILIVHQSLTHIREDDMPEEEAILESVRSRIRPIFMTTLTTLLGLLPLVLFPGAGSELYRGLGSVVLGGLLVSTVFTLVLIPTVFHMTMQIKARMVRLLRTRQPIPVHIPAPPRTREQVATTSEGERN